MIKTPTQLFRRYWPGFLRHFRRRWLILRCLASGIDVNTPVYTVPSSNGGRSAGDVFLALASLPKPRAKALRPVFITHPNHSEVLSWFAHRLGPVVLTRDGENWCAAVHARNRHWHVHQGPDPLPGGINNPWRFFIHHQTRPAGMELCIPSQSPQLAGKNVILIPERGDNSRLGTEHLGTFIAHANHQGYRCYTNGHTNTNFTAKPPLAGTYRMPELNLGQLIAIARDPEIVFVGTRCGLFDILYFIRPLGGAKLVILYPPEPAWLMEARFIRPDLVATHGQYYTERERVYEYRTADFNSQDFVDIIPFSNP